MDRFTLIPAIVRRLPSGRVPRAAIRRYVQKVVDRFHPQRVILFGSHAYGKPTVDSDVDLLVVTRTRSEMDLAVRIRCTVDAPFPLDLIVRTPTRLAQRLKWNDWFLHDIMDQGVVLYDADNTRMGSQVCSSPFSIRRHLPISKF